MKTILKNLSGSFVGYNFFDFSNFQILVGAGALSWLVFIIIVVIANY